MIRDRAGRAAPVGAAFAWGELPPWLDPSVHPGYDEAVAADREQDAQLAADAALLTEVGRKEAYVAVCSERWADVGDVAPELDRQPAPAWWRNDRAAALHRRRVLALALDQDPVDLDVDLPPPPPPLPQQVREIVRARRRRALNEAMRPAARR